MSLLQHFLEREPNMTCMVSLDTSSTCTGYACFHDGEYVESGTLSPDCTDNEERMNKMCVSIIEYLNANNPVIVVAELTVVENNAHTQRLLSEILGVVRGWCIMHDAEFVTYRPNEWRSLVALEDEVIPRKREECKLWAIEKAKEMLNRMYIDDNEAEGYLVGIARINDFIRNDWEEV